MATIGYIYKLERQVVETFRVADAVTPDRAIVPPHFSRYDQRSIFKRFSRKGALVSTGEGRVWLDEKRFAGYMQSRARGLMLFAIGVVVVTIAAIVFL